MSQDSDEIQREPLRIVGLGLDTATAGGPISDPVVLVPKLDETAHPGFSLKLEGRVDRLAQPEIALLVALGGYTVAVAKRLKIDPTLLHVKVTMPDGHSGGFHLTKE